MQGTLLLATKLMFIHKPSQRLNQQEVGSSLRAGIKARAEETTRMYMHVNTHVTCLCYLYFCSYLQHDILLPLWVGGGGFGGDERGGGANLKRHLHICTNIRVCKASRDSIIHRAGNHQKAVFKVPYGT